MQKLHAEKSSGWQKHPYIQYLDLGFEVPDIGATGQARQTGHTGTYGRQRKAPVLALLGASKVTHQTTAGVG